MAEKSNKTSQESLDRLESLKKKFDTRGCKLNKLQEEKASLKRELKEVQQKTEAGLEKAGRDVVESFKKGWEFKVALEELVIDHFTNGYEACLSIVEEKGVYTSSFQLYMLAELVLAVETSEEDDTKEEDFAHEAKPEEKCSKNPWVVFMFTVNNCFPGGFLCVILEYFPLNTCLWFINLFFMHT